MTHISDALVPLQSAAPVPAEQVHVEIDPTAVKKALYVLRTLKNAGIKMHFDSDLEEMALTWAGKLGRYSTGVLDDTIAEWVASETDWPTLGEFDTLCAYTQREQTRMQQQSVAATRTGPCEECDGTRWVRVEDTKPQMIMGGKGGKQQLEVFGHHLRPCSRCPEMADRYELYANGHFDADHVDGGGCRDCRPYQSHCNPKARRGK